MMNRRLYFGCCILLHAKGLKSFRDSDFTVFFIQHFIFH